MDILIILNPAADLFNHKTQPLFQVIQTVAHPTYSTSFRVAFPL